MWHACYLHAICMLSSCGMHVIFMQYACYLNVACMLSSCNMHATLMWHACWNNSLTCMLQYKLSTCTKHYFTCNMHEKRLKSMHVT